MFLFLKYKDGKVCSTLVKLNGLVTGEKKLEDSKKKITKKMIIDMVRIQLLTASISVCKKLRVLGNTKQIH